MWWLLISATILVACLLAWPFALRFKPRAIYGFIFVMLTMVSPLGLYYGLSLLLGYATHDRAALDATPFFVITSIPDDMNSRLFVLVRHEDELEPRLYVITDNYEENKQKFGQAAQLAQKGVPIKGKAEEGGSSSTPSGFEFYTFVEQGPEARK